MIEFRTIKDWRTVWQYCVETTEVERLFDDSGPQSRQGMKRKIHELIENDANMAFEIIYDGTKAGCFLLADLKDGVYDTHILLQKGFRGAKGIEIGKCGTEFALSLSKVRNLVSFCPSNIKESLVFALRCGWKSLGLLPKYWVKNGVAYSTTGVCAI